MKKYSKRDLFNLANGCCFFASGGGGSLSSGLNLVQNFPEDGEVVVVTKEEAVSDTESYSLVIAYIGAPDAIEDLVHPTAAINAYNLMNEFVDGKIKYLVPVEQGALSTIVACVAAQQLNIKVIDGDGAGRAVPELPMLTFADKVPMGVSNKSKEGSILPSAILASKDFQKVEVLVKTPTQVEDIARPFISSGIQGFDQAAGLAIWLMDSVLLDKALSITGTVSLSLELGTLLDAGVVADPYQQVVDFLTANNLSSSLLFTGTMTKPTEKTQGGFDMDEIVIKNAETNVEMHIYAQNESLIAWQSDQAHPTIIAPDSICYLTAEGRPFSNADIKNDIINSEVGVIAIKAREQLTNDKGVMASFGKALTDTGYPGLYQSWNKLT